MQRPLPGRGRLAWLGLQPCRPPSMGVVPERAPWETSGAMSTSPDIVSLGEPLIEFNRPKEGDGRTWLQGFGGDSQNVAIAAARQGPQAGCFSPPRPGLE